MKEEIVLKRSVDEEERKESERQGKKSVKDKGKRAQNSPKNIVRKRAILYKKKSRASKQRKFLELLIF